MKVWVVAMPWQDARLALQAVVSAAKSHNWELTISTNLVEVPSWARYNYFKYDSEKKVDCSLFIWLSNDPLPSVDAPWVITSAPIETWGRWKGEPLYHRWEYVGGESEQHIFSLDVPAKAFQEWAEGRGAWPAGRWTGPSLPGRQCPLAWWSSGVWKPRGRLGFELCDMP
jgi:hypothetical protein